MSEEKKVSAKIEKLLDAVAELSVLELSELVKALEEKFDVKAVAAAPVAAYACSGDDSCCKPGIALKSPDFVPVAPRVAFSGMRQARIENNLFIYLFYHSLCSSILKLPGKRKGELDPKAFK